MNSFPVGQEIFGPFANYTHQGVYPLFYRNPYVSYIQTLPTLDTRLQNIPYINGYSGLQQSIVRHDPNYANSNVLKQDNHNHPISFQNVHLLNQRSDHIKFTKDGINNNNFSQSQQKIVSATHPNHDKSIIDRDGGGHGWGGGHGHGVGNSPAISALALLGFLFFLNLIQNSLQNNRMMMMMMTTTTTTNTTTSSGTSTMTSGRHGRERRKRDTDLYTMNRYVPGTIPSHPSRPIQLFLENKDFPEPKLPEVIRSSIKLDRTLISNRSQISPSVRKKSTVTNSSSTTMIQRLKRISNNCLLLFACTLGRGISIKYGKSTAIMVRSMGKRLLPHMPQSHWTIRALRAWTNGWNIHRKCSNVYNKCTLSTPLGTIENARQIPPWRNESP